MTDRRAVRDTVAQIAELEEELAIERSFLRHIEDTGAPLYLDADLGIARQTIRGLEERLAALRATPDTLYPRTTAGTIADDLRDGLAL